MLAVYGNYLALNDVADYADVGYRKVNLMTCRVITAVFGTNFRTCHI